MLLLVLVLQHPLLVLRLVKVLLLKTLGVLVRIPVLLLVTSLVLTPLFLHHHRCTRAEIVVGILCGSSHR